MTIKKLSIGLLTALTLFGLAACDNDDDDKVITNNQPVASSTTTASSPATASASATLTQDDAKAIALKDAGFAETDVTLLTIEQDTDNGVLTYEIDFVKDTTEYSYTINANSGDILEKSSELAD